LSECIALAQRSNLELKAEELEKQVLREQKTAEMLGMLPELTLKNTYTSRSNTAASSSTKVGPSGLSYGYSSSSEDDQNVFAAELALSTLDFGLAYYNAVQATDREAMKNERVRRISQNLTLDVVKAYFKVAASQRVVKITRQLLNDCRGYGELIKKLSASRAITPFRAFDETRKFTDMEKRLTGYIRNYQNSRIELLALLGMDPSSDIQVEDACFDDNVLKMEFPDLLLLEQIALLERPELYESDMRKRINAVNCRKELIKMIPTVRAFVNFNNDDNTYLYHNTWYNAGVTAAYNLLKLPQTVAAYSAQRGTVQAESEKGFSIAIGIMAQVRISHYNLLAVKERFEIDKRVYDTYKKQLAWATASKKISGDLSKLELDCMKLETTAKQIDWFISLCNVYIAHYQMLNTLGVSKIDTDSVDVIKNELATARFRAEAELVRAEVKYNNRISGADKKQPAGKKKVIDLNVQPLTTFGNSDHVTVGL
jgi:outer membrane protein TolC